MASAEDLFDSKPGQETPPSQQKSSTTSDGAVPPSDSEVGGVKPTNALVARETIESLAVAFILALLFKAFVAEAFVIPTGSMAPTLMGAHKDLICESCGFSYQCGASEEFDENGAKNSDYVIGTVCPLCRKPQSIDPTANPNHITFSGDRILVSKLAYVLNKPRRWDVIVFKFIGHARQNYIKRCLGLPNEIVRVREGDVFIRPDTREAGPFEIARKPPHVINAMLQTVNDTNYIPKELVKAGMPSLWQPQAADDKSWEIEWTQDSWNATAQQVPNGQTSWLRYYHRVVDPVSWQTVAEEGEFPVPPKPRSPRIITDFAAYNAAFFGKLATAKEDVQRLARLSRFGARSDSSIYWSDGIHWTGDLATEMDLEIAAGTQSISLMLVESGCKHIVQFDLGSGQASARVELNGERVAAFDDTRGGLVSEITASTSVRDGKKVKVKFANVDDQLVLWVNGTPVSFTPSNKMQTLSYLPFDKRGPRSNTQDPLDGAPIGLGVQGGTVHVSRAKVFRDIYHISTQNGFTDYKTLSESLRGAILPNQLEDYASQNFGVSLGELLVASGGIEPLQRELLAQNPERWGQSPMIKNRQTNDFVMKDKWYFPMGDNSARSSDGRMWYEHHTPERLLIGRAVVVFWPHYWMRPIPFLPNFQRMGLIR